MNPPLSPTLSTSDIWLRPVLGGLPCPAFGSVKLVLEQLIIGIGRYVLSKHMDSVVVMGSGWVKEAQGIVHEVDVGVIEHIRLEYGQQIAV